MTDEIKRNIRIYIHHGYSFAEVSELTDTKFSEIRRALAEENEEREDFEMPKPLPKEKWTAIAEALRAGGKSQMAITEEHGVSQNTVSKIAKAIKDEGTEKEPAAAATAQGSEETTSDDIISDNTADVKTSEEKISEENEDGSRERETELHDLLKELARNELLFLRTRIRDLWYDLDKCKHRQELLCEYLRGDEVEP